MAAREAGKVGEKTTKVTILRSRAVRKQVMHCIANSLNITWIGVDMSEEHVENKENTVLHTISIGKIGIKGIKQNSSK